MRFPRVRVNICRRCLIVRVAFFFCRWSLWIWKLRYFITEVCRYIVSVFIWSFGIWNIRIKIINKGRWFEMSRRRLKKNVTKGIYFAKDRFLYKLYNVICLFVWISMNINFFDYFNMISYKIWLLIATDWLINFNWLF